MTLWAWSQVYRTPLDAIVHGESLADVEKIGSNCLAGFADLAALGTAIMSLKSKPFLAGEATRQQPWATLLSANTPGAARPAAVAPVYIAQGGRDKIVGQAVTDSFTAQLCAQGVSVTYHRIAEIDHKNIDNRAAPRAVAWMADRLAGVPAASGCRGG